MKTAEEWEREWSSGAEVNPGVAWYRQIQADALESAAREADGWDFGAQIAKNIRALIPKPGSDKPKDETAVLRGSDHFGGTSTEKDGALAADACPICERIDCGYTAGCRAFKEKDR